MKVIQTLNLSKTFDNNIIALSEFNLEVEKGEIFGLLGPNGSGKTTTVRLLNGTLTPSSGMTSILGLQSNNQEVRLKTSTLSESAMMYEHMTVYNNLLFFAAMYNLRESEVKPKIKDLLTRINLWEKRDLKLGSLSTGMKKRIYLVRCLLHSPEIVFLDEPTSGLDPESALQVNQLIYELAKNDGLTVFLCTHNLPLAEMICDTFGFIRLGKMIAVGNKEDIVHSIAEENKLQIDTLQNTHHFNFKERDEINGFIRKILEQGENICEVKVIRPTLEEAYFHYIGKTENELV